MCNYTSFSKEIYYLYFINKITLDSSTISQVHSLEFDWRSAFRGLVPHMAHCVKVVLDDACARSLQQEEALHSAGDTTVALSPTTGDATTSSSLSLSEDLPDTSSERESPKMVAKVQ